MSIIHRNVAQKESLKNFKDMHEVFSSSSSLITMAPYILHLFSHKRDQDTH